MQVDDNIVWIAVGAVVVEGVALAVITYLIWRSQYSKPDGERESPQKPPTDGGKK